MGNTLPLPDSSAQHVGDTGKPTKDFFNWLKSLHDFVNKNVWPSIVVGSPTGANKGIGSINAESVYINGVEAIADPQLAANIPQNSQSAAYTLVLTDGEKHIYHPSSDTTARTWTIPANSSVAFPIGTAITFLNDTSAGTVTIAITSDTLVLAGTGITGSRTLSANGLATALKITSTRWFISGSGLT